MKRKRTLQAEFAPEAQFDVRFELKPAPPVPFRGTQEDEFEQLKNRLLTSHLAKATPELNTPLRRAANDAAAIAWATVYPLLVFPVLFEEKSQLALQQIRRQERIFANSRELLAA